MKKIFIVFIRLLILQDGLRDGLLKRQELSPEELGYLLHPAVRDIDLQDQSNSIYILTLKYLIILRCY